MNNKYTYLLIDHSDITKVTRRNDPKSVSIFLLGRKITDWTIIRFNDDFTDRMIIDIKCLLYGRIADISLIEKELIKLEQ